MRFLLGLFFISCVGYAQKDSSVTIPLVGINFGAHLPAGDMAKRFGPNLGAGGSFLIKTGGNWIFGVEGKYLFGRNVKEDVLSQLKTAEGHVVDNEGYPADLRVTARGLIVNVVAGKLFPLASINRHSGIIVLLGAGYMQHKIHLYDAQQKVAAVRGNLRRGFDRLSNGPATSQFLGYLHLSENRLLNFYAGFECYQGFTKSVRKITYDNGMPDEGARLDIVTGIRVGWILPLYRKVPNA